METAVICLTECDEICGGRVPIIKHAADDLDWHGWDKYEGHPDEELPIYPSFALDHRDEIDRRIAEEDELVDVLKQNHP